MKKSLMATFLLSGGILSAQNNVDISQFKPLAVTSDSKASISQDFNSETIRKLSLPKGFSIDPSGGESGTGALFYHKTDPKAYRIAGYRIKLSPEFKYRATVKYKAENIKNAPGATSRLFCVEFTKKGKHVGGSYFYKKIEENKWTEIVLEFQPPAEFDQTIVGFYLCKNATGKVWWDNLNIEPIGALPATIYDIRPSNLTIRDTEGEVTLKSKVFLKGIPDSDLAAWVTVNGKSRLWKGRDQVYTGSLGNLPDGKVKVDVKLLNLKNKTILAEKAFHLFVKKGEPGGNSSYIDEHGRAIVNGKPFLPIGFYCSRIDESVLKNLKEGGFNCAMPYHGGGSTLTGRFDLAQKYGIRLFMNVMYQRPKGMAQAWPAMEFEGVKGIEPVLQAWARKLKDHPALLGYYVSDENPVEEVPYMRKVRELLSEADPDHFTVTLTYIGRHFPFFAETGDVLAVDTYPVETGASRSMEGIPDILSAAGAVGISPWLVPQAFNWGNYKTKDPNEYKKYRFPTEQEMRSMYLAGAVNGAKGFLLYNYSDIFGTGEKRIPGSAAENWPKVVAAVKPLKELAPFILSIEKAPEVKTGKMQKAQLKAWNADGKTAVAVVGIGPGESIAEFTIPGRDNLKSRYGATRNLGGGKYRFTGKDISSDVLFSE